MRDLVEDAALLLAWPVGFVVIAAFISGLLAVLNISCRAFHRHECAGFAAETGREARFVDYGWGSYECLVMAPDGKWVPSTALRVELSR